jgi:hypothetical protein
MAGVARGLEEEGSDEGIVALVTVRSVENVWVMSEIGPIPFLLAACELEERLRGAGDWPEKTVRTVLKADANELVLGPDSFPPPREGRRYVLWATPLDQGENPKELRERDVRWLAEPPAFVLLFGQPGDESYHLEGQGRTLASLRTALREDRKSEMDPSQRLDRLRRSIRTGRIADPDRVIGDLLLNILEPEKQIEKVAPARVRQPGEGLLDGPDKIDTHTLWYESLALLRDMGLHPKHREKVVKAIATLVSAERKEVRLPAALALAEFEDRSGLGVLSAAYESGSRQQVSSISSSQFTFPGRYRHDGAVVTAAAHALGLLGDARGLRSSDVTIVLAAAEGLVNSPVEELKPKLQDLARRLDARVETARKKGELSRSRNPGDFTTRVPLEWIGTHSLLARLGEEASLRALVEAWLEDQTTYLPVQEMNAVATPITSSHTPGDPTPLQAAIYRTDPSGQSLLASLRKLFSESPLWVRPELIRLRASLGDEEAKKAVSDEEAKRAMSLAARIVQGLDSAEPSERARSLAEAGQNEIENVYDRVLARAVEAEGEERQAALYALGLYRRRPPEGKLRELMGAGDVSGRITVLELATRKDPGKFSVEGLVIAKAAVVALREAKDDRDRFGLEHQVEFLPRVLARLPRASLPAEMLTALQAPDPDLRRLVATALGLAGDPEAVPALRPLLEDSNEGVREAARRAMESLGPAPR